MLTVDRSAGRREPCAYVACRPSDTGFTRPRERADLVPPNPVDGSCALLNREPAPESSSVGSHVPFRERGPSLGPSDGCPALPLALPSSPPPSSKRVGVTDGASEPHPPPRSQ